MQAGLALLGVVASTAAVDRPSSSSNASSWWFVAPADDAVTLQTGAAGSFTLSSGVLSFRFALNGSDVLLSSVARFRCTDADCDGGGDVFSFPGTYTKDCNQVNCSAGRPVPEPHASMATVMLDHRQFYLGHPSSPVPAAQRKSAATRAAALHEDDPAKFGARIPLALRGTG